MASETTKVGRRGTIVIPASLRRQYCMDEGSLIVAEPTPEGILLRPAVALPVETYSPIQKAEFLLNNAVSDDDMRWAEEEIRKMGLDPNAVRSDAKE
ncbi:MAG: AbrB/MazE/SpoVT family DNA-binding domain-containing protein [Eubacteriales bacterium]|nr:AbrB/MazE/SpoVT family DNA-binding domain-containing protein [Bacillota bacterium]MBV1727497.1 AbrB/MazE/SpoVT family DNA-binding domain-containing protein [Desulforudis sp.]MDP3050047.1 AbrB/MazE/SpoVT family DNA-binding domain-containing protein [Eubacteriales bacterium]MBU4534199.1 AbrB/MazE/SpoVT family DNA-binding domain-containing protein [Bacillota bacterium]MBU4553845.1 AbrB/MazE/SpoVT family DNA-binding domain-containing protein [Bacillota bacterium]